MPDSIGNAVPDNFVGLSFEASRIGDTVQFSTTDSGLGLLFNEIGPGVMRIGGNSLDINGPNVLDTARYSRFFDFVKKTGWKLQMGLGLGTFDTVGAADVASFTSANLGGALLSYEVGNEADQYSSNGLRPSTWGLADYETALRSIHGGSPIARAIRCVFRSRHRQSLPFVLDSPVRGV